MKTRKEVFSAYFDGAPAFREKQFFLHLFSPENESFLNATPFPLDKRELLDRNVPFFSLQEEMMFQGIKQDVWKAILVLSDGKRIESVLMRNARNAWTVCVSTQVGCAMNCSFCATGKMGFFRNLSEDEIVDQYRFWNRFLFLKKNISGRISNVVYMGMGEPLANYDAVKSSLRNLLLYTDLGPTRITVSSVGLLPMLEKILGDTEWPPVRIALSLHSADSQTRKDIMPTSFDGFLDALAQWTKRYFDLLPERRRHLTFEYILLDGVNDTDMHAQKLARFANRIGKVKINLIPFNETGKGYARSTENGISRFQEILLNKGVDVTRRRAMGEDIAAACGQLVIEKATKGA